MFPINLDLTVPIDTSFMGTIELKQFDLENFELEKDDSKKDKSKQIYERPMTMGFHYKKSLASIDRIDNSVQSDVKKKIDIHDPSSIKFYHKGSPYYEFTNFYEAAPIKISGQLFKTAEHYYQWQKFIDPVVKSRIIAATTGSLAIDAASKNKNLVDPKFKKNDAMLNTLRAKFSQHEDLGRLLLSTGNRQLIEHNMLDDYWSDGGDGSGQNQFGILLMKVRSELHDGTLTFAKPFIG